MEGADKKIEALIQEGNSFNFDNFSTKSRYGNTAALSPEWVTWVTRVAGAIERLFEKEAPSVRLIRSASAIQLYGNGSDKFDQARSYYIGALATALDALKDDIFGEVALSRSIAMAPMAYSNKVFVVHGHDEKTKQELEILLTEMGLEPVVLHRQADGGRTIIEKFEHYSDVGFAFILMTPDEIAYLVSAAEFPDAERKSELRARPNVIFEFGFFVGRLGRARTCCIYRGDVAVPSDLSGLIYKKFDRSVEEIGWALSRELKAAGYALK